MVTRTTTTTDDNNNNNNNHSINERFEWKNPEEYNEQGEKRWKRSKPPQRTNVGTRPHRCAVRYTDFLASITATGSSLSIVVDRWRLFYSCMRSQVGQEPRDPLEYVDDDTYEFYREMQMKRKIRTRFYDKNSNPFDTTEEEVYLPPRRQDLIQQEQQQQQQE